MIDNLSRDVAQLTADHVYINKRSERFELAIEKLTDVSANISQLLAVQASRLDIHEKANDQIEILIEKRRIESQIAVETISQRIEEKEEEFKKDMKESNREIIAKLDAMQKSLNEKVDDKHSDIEAQIYKLSNKLSTVEKWMWTATGVFAVIIFLVEYINIGALFIK